MSNNATRAHRCAKAIALYGNRDPNPATQLIDLLADIRHWCDRHGEDFARLDRLAYDHYLTELHDERTKP